MLDLIGASNLDFNDARASTPRHFALRSVAQPRDQFKLVVGQGMLLTAIGLAIGGGASFAPTRLIQRLLFGVSATDPLTFVTIRLLLAAVALLACYMPARRATRVNPLAALRYE